MEKCPHCLYQGRPTVSTFHVFELYQVVILSRTILTCGILRLGDDLVLNISIHTVKLKLKRMYTAKR